MSPSNHDDDKEYMQIKAHEFTPVPTLPGYVIWAEAAEFLGVSENRLHEARRQKLIGAIQNKHTGIAQMSTFWFARQKDIQEALLNKPEWLIGKLAKKEKSGKKRVVTSVQKEKKNLSKVVTVHIHERQVEPKTVVCHLGPTNSGKTHDALHFLAKEGQGVYAAPLRMLAQEAHKKLIELAGEENVGLVTGEERINENAPIICCTAEMAAQSGNTLVLDEVHWANDLERGSAWTKLLLTSEYQHYRLVGAWDAKPLLEKFFPNAEFIYHERRTPLTYNGAYQIKTLPKKTVVITFSRKSVLSLAIEIHQETGRGVSALYGAMPVAARREEIRRFISGESEIMVATDVLSHGINLPCDHVVFAETNKYDGNSRRNLVPWEVAQTAGRAGRFGLSEKGHTGILTGLVWSHPLEEVVQSGLKPKNQIEGKPVYNTRLRARLAPQLNDFTLEHNQLLGKALAVWEKVASGFAKQHGEWMSIESTAPLRTAFEFVRQTLGARDLDGFDQEDIWGIIHAPIDPEKDQAIYRQLVENLFRDRRIPMKFTEARKLDLQEAENAARKMAILRWYGYRFGGGIDLEKVRKKEEEYSMYVAELVQHEVKTAANHGRQSCGDKCAPWFDYCNGCFQRSRSSYYHYDQ